MKFVTFKNLGSFGRLGNQLYQCAAVISLANKHGFDVKFPSFDSAWHGQKCLMGEFNLSYETMSSNDTIQHHLNEATSKSGQYDENLDNSLSSLNGNVNLHGFFQNTKYLIGGEELVREKLMPKKHYLEDARSYINSLNNNKKEIVGIHVRRGDNTDGTNASFFKNLYGENLMDESTKYGSYIKKALEIFPTEKYDFLVFTGGSRTVNNESDLDWCKRVFPKEHFFFSESNDTMTDFSRLMSCDHNILSHTSSFGWWAAYLNTNKNKKVVAPLLYTPHEECPEHFFPKDWILL